MEGNIYIFGILVLIIVIWRTVIYIIDKRKKRSGKPLTQVSADNAGVSRTGNAAGERPVSLLASLPAENNEASQEEEDSVVVLAKALHYGFRILRGIMFLLAVIFIFSNIYWIEEGMVAIHLRFGQILNSGTAASTVKPGGPYFALPYPIDRIIKIPTTIRKVAIDKAFWVEEDGPDTSNTQPSEKPDRRTMAAALTPGYDGSLMTADKNVVQGQWSVNYQLDYDRDRKGDNAPELFAANTGSLEKADALVHNVVAQAIVKVVARTTVDDFVKGRIDNELLLKYSQKTLDSLQSGIRLNNIAGERYTVALYLQDDFRAVTKAESEKAEQIESAKRYRSEILNESGGADFQKLLDAICKYEMSSKSGKPQEKILAEQEITKIFQSDLAGGQISELISSALIYKSGVIEWTRGASERFKIMLEQYEQNPVIIRNRMVQDTLQAIFSGRVKSFYLPPNEGKTLYLELTQ